jgi:hypothetical protein
MLDDIWSRLFPTTTAGWVCSSLAITFTMACMIIAYLDESDSLAEKIKRKRNLGGGGGGGRGGHQNPSTLTTRNNNRSRSIPHRLHKGGVLSPSSFDFFEPNIVLFHSSLCNI